MGRYAHTYVHVHDPWLRSRRRQSGEASKRPSEEESEGEFEGLSFEIRALSGLRVVV